MCQIPEEPGSVVLLYPVVENVDSNGGEFEFYNLTSKISPEVVNMQQDMLS